MINQSKANDMRFWNKWRESGAIGSIQAADERQARQNQFNMHSVNEREVGILVQENRPLSGIEQALTYGCNIHGFLSGGGLRVVRIEQDGVLKGYGEHPHVDHALRHADEDYLAGGRDYHDVYGKKHFQYLTGSTSPNSPLDVWVRQGRTFDAEKLVGKIIVELHGYGETREPQEVMKQVNETGQPVSWASRGYTYETSRYTFPNGELGHSTRVLESPEGKKGNHPFSFNIVKSGVGNGFLEALEDAFKAEEVEVERGGN